MIEGLFGRGAIPVLRTGVAFAQDRQRALLNNVANADTPGYLFQDLPVERFKRALSEAVQKRDLSGDRYLSLEEQGGIRRTATGRFTADPVGMVKSSLRHDDNNVSQEQAMSMLSENTLWHNGMAAMLAQQYNLIGMAIRGRV